MYGDNPLQVLMAFKGEGMCYSSEHAGCWCSVLTLLSSSVSSGFIQWRGEAVSQALAKIPDGTLDTCYILEKLKVFCILIPTSVAIKKCWCPAIPQEGPPLPTKHWVYMGEGECWEVPWKLSWNLTLFWHFFAYGHESLGTFTLILLSWIWARHWLEILCLIFLSALQDYLILILTRKNLLRWQLSCPFCRWGD